MKSFFAKRLLVATVIIAVQLTVTYVRAWESPNLKPLFLKQDPCCAWNVGGHLETGLYANQYGQKNVYGQDELLPDSGNTALLQNVWQSDLQLNQGWLYLEKELKNRCGWDIGGRVDYVFGTDARYLQSDGLEKSAGHGRWGSGDYNSAIAQMYFEVGNKDFSIKAGKFITPMGIDPIVSTDRFFYSLSKNFGLLPVTHTGLLVDWNFNRKLSAFAGWTQGAGDFFETSKNNAFLGGFEYKFNPCTKWGYSVMIGDDSRDDYSYFVHSLYLKHKLSQRWDYSLDWVLSNNDDDFGDSFGGYGINNSFYYTLNCRWALGFRMEWNHYYDSGNSSDVYGLVFGANWKPCDWLLVRPEVRYDSIHGEPGVFNYHKNNGNGKSDQFAGGFSVVVKF